jgi:hypothetical protein
MTGFLEMEGAGWTSIQDEIPAEKSIQAGL